MGNTKQYFFEVMSTFAKDIMRGVISADDAVRSEDYFCLECGSIVRLRLGEERRAHFYHLEPTLNCRESGKSLEHLMAQIFIQKEFQKANQKILLEKRFPSIDRIADAVLLEHNIVFEIQCSPMKSQEAFARMRDYGRIGFQVVWILHTKTFFKRKATAFEKNLLHTPHYFTDIDEKGNGSIFDLFAPIKNGYRQKGLERFIIDIADFQKNKLKIPFRKQWPLIFSGDIADNIRQKSLDETLYACIAEDLFSKADEFPKPSYFQKGLFHLKLFWDELLHRVAL